MTCMYHRDQNQPFYKHLLAILCAGSRSAASHPAHRGVADIDDMATVLTWSAVCLWDSDFRMILTFVARILQMAWDAGARVLVVNT